MFKKQGSAGSMDLVQCVKAADSLIEFFQRLEKWLGAFAATHTLSEKRELPGPPLAESLAKEVLGTLTRVGVVFHTKNGRICMKPVGGSAGLFGFVIHSHYCVPFVLSIVCRCQSGQRSRRSGQRCNPILRLTRTVRRTVCSFCWFKPRLRCL